MTMAYEVHLLHRTREAFLETGAALAMIGAVIVRPMLLPAAAEVLGRHSWWPTTHAAFAPADAKLPRPTPRPTRPLTAMEGPT